MKKRSIQNTGINMSTKSGYCGVFMIFCLVFITLYMAFAFPYTLLQLKQTDTTEIKSVIVIARSGERAPSAESYFINEEPSEDLLEIGFNQLTNDGKERMHLLGKFLKMRYYHLLLNGNPRKIHVRSSDVDRNLESAEALLAGLNPPKDCWLWSNELENWQPKAIHTTAQEFDDLLAEEPNCYAYELEKVKWKNSTKYQQLLNEFRHDLQTLRTNTGLEFEDDLEMLSDIEDSLKTRKAYKESTPNWYTSTFANRLAHIADVTTEHRFSSANIQRLYVGRLLHEIAENVNSQIRLHQQQMLASDKTNKFEDEDNYLVYEKGNSKGVKPASNNNNEPNMFIYMTNKQRLSALMNSLQIYSSQPHFGAMILIELHYDPINNLHFLRLFSVSSTNPKVLPEPLRVNPLACVDSVECEPQQFEQNIRHLMLEKWSWQEVCMNQNAPTTTAPPKLPLIPIISDNPVLPASTTTMAPATTTIDLEQNLIVGPEGGNQQVEPTTEPATTTTTQAPTSSELQTESAQQNTSTAYVVTPVESTTTVEPETKLTTKIMEENPIDDDSQTISSYSDFNGLESE